MTADTECPRCKLFPRPHTCVPPTGKAALKVPSIHLNGTSGVDLFEQVKKALDATAAAVAAHISAAPHGRDYYVQGDTAWKVARDQWESRQRKLGEVQDELTEIMHAIYDAMPDRDRR